MSQQLQVFKYDAGRKRVWDDFVARAKNGVFLFQRDYMEYHADRFTDASLLVFDESGRLVALLPASVRGDVVSSHGGLTFGGFITDERMKAALMLEVFDAARAHLREQGITKLIYKAIPHIYHRVPAEEDLYALYRAGARLFRRDISSTVLMSERLPFSKGRKYSVKQAQKRGLRVEQSFDFQTFMAMEADLLGEKYGARPVHTAAEIELLAARFPDNIKLFAAFDGAQMLAGVVVYESSEVAHAQYISASDEGKQSGALDLIISYLINEYYAHKKYFDFGISTEDEGRYLNTGLIENKQGFGGRAIVYDFYEVETAERN
ncbi:MAG TPA: GNAT family N-acetyltransferase [Pyrinomonadaceae bacterium]|nr:GNAT family N-acetyltransferase [Pyrinomonadaceae bacterium]